MSNRAVDYYDARTQHILRKYGPGPRVHFHSGIVEEDPAEDADVATLQRAIVAAQEELLADSARAWGTMLGAGRDLLDVGCGLGGGALYWAQELGARVCALTNVASHVDIVRGFAQAAGVAGQVRCEHGDATTLPGPARFDAAVAIESTCYLAPREFFGALDRVLRPGGRVYILDGFEGRPGVAAWFDAYWRTSISSLESFESGARESGFRLVKVESLGPRVASFWRLSLQRSHLERCSTVEGTPEHERLQRSIAAHNKMQRNFLDGGIAYLRLELERCATAQ